MSTFDINLKSTFSKVNIMSDGYVTKIFSILPKPHRVCNVFPWVVVCGV